MDNAQRWNTWASISTVIAAVIAAVAFAWGAKTDLDGARAQTQATSLQVLQGQLQLAVEHPELAATDADDPAALEVPGYVWFAMNALLTADTLYGLAGDDPEWRNTADALVQQHRAFVFSSEFPCDLFNDDFLRFVREETRAAAEPEGVTVCPGRLAAGAAAESFT